jgi:hypothetical protein
VLPPAPEGQSPSWGNMLEGVNLEDNALSEDPHTRAFFVDLAQQSKSSWKASKEELFYAAQWVAKKGTVGVLRACHEADEFRRPPDWDEVHHSAFSMMLYTERASNVVHKSLFKCGISLGP